MDDRLSGKGDWMIRKHILVHGRVQGVGFRYYTQGVARKLGILGWVRNRPDKTVEIDAQGEAKALNRFLAAVRKGSSASRVDRIQTAEKKTTGSFRTFEIRH